MPRGQAQEIPVSALRQMRDNAWDENSTLIFNLLAYTGAKRNELLPLRWQDVEWSANHLLIPGRNARAMPLHPELKKVLGRFADTPTDPLLVPMFRRGPMSVATFERWVADLAGDLPYRPLDFRHTVSQSLYRNGVPPQVIDRMLGWASPAGARYSIVISDQEMQEAILRLYADDPL